MKLRPLLVVLSVAVTGLVFFCTKSPDLVAAAIACIILSVALPFDEVTSDDWR